MLGFTLIAAFLSRKIANDYLRNLKDASRIVPTVWDLKTGKNVLWRVPLGSVVHRSPVVHGEQIYVGTNNAAGFLPRYPAEVDLGVLLCFQISDGKLLWQHSNEKLPTGRVHDWPLQGISSRPCVERDRLWYVTNRCEVVCLDTEGFRDAENDGPCQDEEFTDEMEADIVWRFDMMGELGVSPHNLSTCTPAVWGESVFVVTGNGVSESHLPPVADAPSFLALDKTTGKVLWTDNSPGHNVMHGQWASPVVAKLGGAMQALFPGGDGWLYSFDPKGTANGKGKLLWKFDCNPKDSKWILGGRGTRNNLLHAPTIHEGLVYIAMGQDPEHGEGQGRVWCIDPTRRGDVSPAIVFNEKNPDVPIPHRRIQASIAEQGDFIMPNPNSAAIWQFDQHDANGNGEIEFEERMGRSLSSVEIKDDLLFVSDLAGVLHCLDRQTGHQHWGFDLWAQTYSSPVIAGKHVYIGDEDGEIAVFGLSSDPKVAMPSGMPLQEIYCGKSINGTMNVKNNVMYIVTHGELIAVGEPKPSEP